MCHAVTSSADAARDEALLGDDLGGGSIAPSAVTSLRLDAIDVGGLQGRVVYQEIDATARASGNEPEPTEPQAMEIPSTVNLGLQ